LRSYATSPRRLFLAETKGAYGHKIGKDLQGSNTLTVGESEGFAAQGAIINLVIEGNKVHFEFNPAAAAWAELKISSKLLTMAKIVKEQRNQGKS
jgi:hypothetical protein